MRPTYRVNPRLQLGDRRSRLRQASGFVEPRWGHARTDQRSAGRLKFKFTPAPSFLCRVRRARRSSGFRWELRHAQEHNAAQALRHDDILYLESRLSAYVRRRQAYYGRPLRGSCEALKPPFCKPVRATVGSSLHVDHCYRSDR